MRSRRGWRHSSCRKRVVPWTSEGRSRSRCPAARWHRPSSRGWPGCPWTGPAPRSSGATSARCPRRIRSRTTPWLARSGSHPRRCPTRASTACEPTPPTSTERQRSTRTTWCACWARHLVSTWRSWAWDRMATSAPCSRATRCCASSGGGSLPSRTPRSRRRRRLTLTLPALEAAELVIVAAFGSGKAAAVRAALHDPESELPVALATRRARRALFLLDPQACDTPSA